MFSFRAEASVVDGNNRLSFTFSLSFLFFSNGKIIYGWIADVFFGSWLSEWGEKMDGRNEWEARGGMPWKHGFYRSIKIYTTTAGLQLTPSLCALDWHLSTLLQIAFCVAPSSVSYPLGARARGAVILRANRKRGCERSGRPAAADTSRNGFSHTRAVTILRSVTHPIWTSPSDSSSLRVHWQKNSANHILPSNRGNFSFTVEIKNMKIEILGLSFVVFCHVVGPYVAAQCTIVSVQCADNTNKLDLLV